MNAAFAGSVVLQVFLCTTSCCTWAAASAAPALAKAASQLPEALSSIKRADGVCRRETSPGVDVSTESAAWNAPDLACAMDAPTVAGLLGRPDIVIVDVRDAASHRAYHIEGALNIDAPSVRSKPHFKRKTLILAGDGRGERDLYSACMRLKQEGFSHPAVLRGGMVAWAAQGQPAIGDALGLLRQSALSPTQLWAESQFEKNVVLVTSDRQGIQSVLSYTTSIPDASIDAIRSTLERRRRELKGEPLASVILVSGLLGGEAAVQRLRAALQPIPLLTYPGTVDEFKRANAQQAAVWRARARGPKQPACGR